MTTQAEKYIENSLALAPDNLKNIDAKYINVVICYKFEDGSEAEFDGTYIAKTGQCRWYSTKITNTKSKNNIINGIALGKVYNGGGTAPDITYRSAALTVKDGAFVNI